MLAIFNIPACIWTTALTLPQALFLDNLDITTVYVFIMHMRNLHNHLLSIHVHPPANMHPYSFDLAVFAALNLTVRALGSCPTFAMITTCGTIFTS